MMGTMGIFIVARFVVATLFIRQWVKKPVPARPNNDSLAVPAIGYKLFFFISLNA